MTREELVEELNKIDGVVVEYHQPIEKIDICTEKFIISYDFSNSLRIVPYIINYNGFYIENRTPEQILSVVKALVG